MPQKEDFSAFQRIFMELNTTNREYALAILRSLKFAEEQAARELPTMEKNVNGEEQKKKGKRDG